MNQESAIRQAELSEAEVADEETALSCVEIEIPVQKALELDELMNFCRVVQGLAGGVKVPFAPLLLEDVHTMRTARPFVRTAGLSVPAVVGPVVDVVPVAAMVAANDVADAHCNETEAPTMCPNGPVTDTLAPSVPSEYLYQAATTMSVATAMFAMSTFQPVPTGVDHVPDEASEATATMIGCPIGVGLNNGTVTEPVVAALFKALVMPPPAYSTTAMT